MSEPRSRSESERRPAAKDVVIPRAWATVGARHHRPPSNLDTVICPGHNHTGGAAMANAADAVANKPAWIDLGTTDAAAAGRFYSTVFGWDVEVNPDPQYGGYGLARLGGK